MRVKSILIKSLSPVIISWTRCRSTVVSKTAFAYLDHILFFILLARTSHRHPNKSKTWIMRKYWGIAANETIVSEIRIEMLRFPTAGRLAS